MKFYLRFLVVVLFLVGTFNFVSAGYDGADYKEKISVTKYCPEHSKSITRTVEAYYDNDDRYSTYDYRWGYSHRTEESYWKKYHGDFYDWHDFDCGESLRFRDYKRDYRRDSWRDSRKEHSWGYYHYNDYSDYSSSNISRDYGKDTYWKFNHATRKYEQRTCYHYPPRGQLFYVKC